MDGSLYNSISTSIIALFSTFNEYRNTLESWGHHMHCSQSRSGVSWARQLDIDQPLRGWFEYTVFFFPDWLPPKAIEPSPFYYLPIADGEEMELYISKGISTQMNIKRLNGIRTLPSDSSIRAAIYYSIKY